MQFQDDRGAIPVLAEKEMMPEDDDYDNIYNDVNVGEGFIQTLQQQPASDAPPSAPFGNGLPCHNPYNRHGAESQDPRVAEQRSTSGFVPETTNMVPGLAPEFRGALPTLSLSGGDPKFAKSGPSMMMDPARPGIRGPPLMSPNPGGLMANRPVTKNENIMLMVDN